MPKKFWKEMKLSTKNGPQIFARRNLFAAIKVSYFNFNIYVVFNKLLTYFDTDI